MTELELVQRLRNTARSVADGIDEFGRPDEEAIHYLDMALEALGKFYAGDLAAQQGPEIKGVEWESVESTSEFACVREWWCMYRITLRTDGQKQLRLEWLGNKNDDLGIFLHWDQAKAAAQADYETRIRTALAPSVVAEPTPYVPAVIEFPDGGYAQLVLEDTATITGEVMEVEALHRMAEPREIIGFQWSLRTPSPHKGEPVAFASKAIMAILAKRDGNPHYALLADSAQDGLVEALFAAPPPMEGMVSVPREAWDELLDDLQRWDRLQFGGTQQFRNGSEKAKAVVVSRLKAMIAATPNHPEPGAGE